MAPPVKRAAAAPRKKAGGGGKRPPPKARLPEGTELTDLKKQAWLVGRVIGEGGFGLVYLGSGTLDCVIKAEPKGNGPLFCEMHFYQRAADGTRVADWARQRGLEYVGVPRFYGCGLISHAGVEHRFLAIERLGEDLERRFERERDPQGRQPARRAFDVAVRVLDALEFVHDSGYAHADVKASNLLTSAAGDRIYLADFGLAFRYFADGRWLKEEKEDPKRRHDGTSEFCSRDAHRGLAPTPRADLENLGWCLLAWLTGELPWQPYRDASDRVQQAKEAAVASLAGFLAGRDFARPADAETVVELLGHSAGLGYHERPQYRRLRDLLRRRADAADAATASTSSGVVGNGVAAKKTKASAAKAKPPVAKASPRSSAAVAKASPRSSAAVAKASPRSSAAVAKASPRSSAAVAKASPRSTAAASRKTKSPTVAKASPRATASASRRTKLPAVAKASPRATTAASSNGGNGDAADAASSCKRKSGSCQTSPHLLKEAKRLARGGKL